jgi:hypothetical protein
MSIKETVQTNDGQPARVRPLDDKINKRFGTRKPFLSLTGPEWKFTAMSPDFILVEPVVEARDGRMIQDRRRHGKTLLKDEINQAEIRVVAENGTVTSWSWERTPDGRGRVRRGLDVVKARIHDAPR